MKELARTDLESLKQRVAQADSGRCMPWPLARVRDSQTSASHDHDFAQPLPPPDPRLDMPALHGIERRLVRRAEALWRSLCPLGGLPPQSAASTLMGAPFGPQSVLFRIPAASRASPATMPIARAIGSRIEALGQGSATVRSVLVRRLALLAAKAHHTGQPAFYDSETESPGMRSPRHGPALMVRAVGLPLAPPLRGGATVVVVASWREILSARDTRALQQELANAIAWMRSNGFSIPS